MSDRARTPQFHDISAKRGLVLSFSALMIALWLVGEPLTHLLRYERVAVLSGEVWRVFTCHLVHADGRHLAVNLAGLWLVSLLVGREFAVGEWLMVALASAIVIGAAFLTLDPTLEWYVGLSGVLHGLLAAGAAAWALRGERRQALVLGGLLAGKLLWEQVAGPLPFAGRVPVIVSAHLYGALGGAAMGLLLARRRR